MAVNTTPQEVPLERPMPGMTGVAGLWQRLKWPILTVVEVVAVLYLWDTLVLRFEIVNPVLFPAPSAMASELANLISSGELSDHLAFSLRNLVIGYGSGALLGISAGLFIGASRVLERLWGPIIWSAYSTPIITIRPLLIIWFGFGWTSLAFLVFLSSLFPILINTMAGVHTVDESLLRAGRVFGASRLQMYTKIILPYTVPFILTGLRLAIGAALIGMLVGELVSSNMGLGYIVAMGASHFNMSRAFAAVAVLVAMSLALVNSVKWIEDRVAPWRKGGR